MRSVIIAVLAGMVFLSGCKTFEPEKEKEVSLPLTLANQFSSGPASKGAAGAAAVQSDGEWWYFLNSEELNSIIDHALKYNFDIKTLEARLEQARANISKAEASFFPDLSFSIGGQKKGTQTKRSRSSSSSYDGSHSWDGSLTSSYSPDIWGEARAEKKAKISSHGAAEQNLKASSLELSGTIAETWVDIIAARIQSDILEKQIKANYTLLELLKLRFVNGRATALEVSQQQEAIAQAASLAPLLEKQEQLLINALVLLSGKAVPGSIVVNTEQIPAPLPLPDIGIPTDLLENRPDIQAAKMRLYAAQWEVRAARADLMPSFNLSAQALFSSGQLDLLFHNWVVSLVAGIGGPIFEGGLRRAEVERVKAVAKEQIYEYASAVAGAVLEVENSLVSIEKQDEYVRLLEQELAVARITLKDARVQYQNGQSSYLNYLVAWTAIQRLERQLVGEQATAIKERITLHKSLGRQPSFAAQKRDRAEQER